MGKLGGFLEIERAEAPELRTAKRSPARPRKKARPAVAP